MFGAIHCLAWISTFPAALAFLYPLLQTLRHGAWKETCFGCSFVTELSIISSLLEDSDRLHRNRHVFSLKHIRLATECDDRDSYFQEPETSFKIVLGNRTL
jgi:hypothetical protein